MTKDEALKLALEALEDAGKDDFWRYQDKAITAIKEALAQPKYRRGDRLICLETDEYCVIHISGTDRQWIKFPDSYIGVYTNEQVAELFELLPKEPEPWEKFCDSNCVWTDHHPDCKLAHEPVSAQCKFESEDLWLPCSIEHHNFVQSEPEKWPQYQTRLLYAMPPQRKPLTDEEIEKEWQFLHDEEGNPPDHYDFARAIEAAHGIKGEA